MGELSGVSYLRTLIPLEPHPHDLSPSQRPLSSRHHTGGQDPAYDLGDTHVPTAADGTARPDVRRNRPACGALCPSRATLT